jgi:PTS system nitrogen regulatory IIA component
VQTLFVMLVPEEASDLHLQVLSELAQLFSSKSLREALLAAKSKDELYQLLTQWSSHA